MSYHTGMRTFTSNANLSPSGCGKYNSVDDGKGLYDADLHVGTDAVIEVRKYQTCVTVNVEAAETPTARFHLFISPEGLDAAVAMRDALNEAIRHARKLAKEA